MKGFWDEQYDPNLDELSLPENQTEPDHVHAYHNHPNITPLPSGKFRAYKTIQRQKTYLGTFDTLEQALEAQSILGPLKPSLQRVKRRHVPLSSLVNIILDHEGEFII